MPTETPRTHRRPPLLAILIVPLAAALVLALFAWPQARMEPRGLPVGVAGTPAVAQGLAAQGDAFEIHRYADQAAARAAIADREVYGALVADGDGATVLTASAASPAVAQMLTTAAHANGHGRVQVEDVAPAQRVGALGASILPLILAGTLTALLSGLFAARGWRRAAIVTGGAVLAGLAATAVVQSWLEIVDGNWFANAGALSLTVLAVAATIAGLEALFGHAGAALGALTMILIGNPFAGVASGPEMLPRPVGDLGQLLPPGAGGNLLRSTGYFDGAAAGGSLAVLAVWAGAGLLAMLAAGALRRRTVTAPALGSAS